MLLTIALTLAPSALVTQAAADGPGVGTPAVVTLGDSAISGEAGRWAGNTNDDSARVDALGPTAYWDTATGESIANCHRSKAAQVFIGGGVLGYNLACSGATTSTHGDRLRRGLQARHRLLLRRPGARRARRGRCSSTLAATHNVKAVVVMIGANNYGFADIVTRCVEDWATSPAWWKNYCSDDSDMTSTLHLHPHRHRVRQTYKPRCSGCATRWSTPATRRRSTRSSPRPTGSPLPRGAQIRYPESGWTRQTIGGCGVWNRDADWANDVGRQRAEHDDPQRGLQQRPGQRQGARPADRAERAPPVREHRRPARGEGRRRVERAPAQSTRPNGSHRSAPRSTIFGPYQLQEDSHASYWGQLAMRNCLRQAYNGGAVRGGACVRSANGLNGRGEPQMALQ